MTTAIGPRRLREMAEQATVDAYGESEQISGWSCMLDEHLAVPFETVVLGVAVIVERLDLRDDLQIVAICRRGRARQAIEIGNCRCRHPSRRAPSGSRPTDIGEGVGERELTRLLRSRARPGNRRAGPQTHRRGVTGTIYLQVVDDLR